MLKRSFSLAFTALALLATACGESTEGGPDPVDQTRPDWYFAGPSVPTATTAIYQYRMTAMDISEPAALTARSVSSILSGALDNLSFLWLIELDLTHNTLRTGAGEVPWPSPPFEDRPFPLRWNEDPRYAPAGPIAINLVGETFSATAAIRNLTVPIYVESADNPDELEPLIELPFEQVEIHDMELMNDRTTIGQPEVDADLAKAAESWETSGTLTGWILRDAADQVTFPDGLLPGTLCTLLGGVIGADSCAEALAEDIEFRYPPLPHPVTGEPAFRLSAGIGGGLVQIEE